MTHPSLLTAPRPTVRPLAWRDLPQVLHLLRQTDPTPPGTDPALWTALQSRETVVCVAECCGRVAGFVVCAVVPQPEAAAGSPFRRLTEFLRRLVRPSRPELVRLTLLGCTVAPDWPQADLEHALLECLGRELRQGAGRVEILVPETNLAAQLVLRGAGYRATEILHGSYGGEDGYLMVSQRG